MLDQQTAGRPDRDSGFASPSFVAEAVQPLGSARVLPPAAFRSLEFWQLEDLAVWTRDWVCVGTHDDIPGTGDLLPFTVGHHGLHVQRGHDGIAARFNKAQHGGCRVVPVQCQGGSKTRCSFTSCGYSRDRGPIPAGELGDSAPEMHQYLGLRPERLLTAPVRSWGPLIFLNLAATPPDFGEAIAGLGQARSFFDNQRGARLGTRIIEPSANWKQVGEGLLGDHFTQVAAGPSWIAGMVGLGDGSTLDVAWVFPNLVLLADADQTCAVVLQPTAIGKTMCRVSVFGAEDRVSDGDERWADRLALLMDRAETAQEAVERWGTTSRPETLDAALPMQPRQQGLWMQTVLSRRVLGVSASDLDLQRFQLSRLG